MSCPAIKVVSYKYCSFNILLKIFDRLFYKVVLSHSFWLKFFDKIVNRSNYLIIVNLQILVTNIPSSKIKGKIDKNENTTSEKDLYPLWVNISNLF